MQRYFVTESGKPEREVSKAEYVAAERRADFYNTLGQPDEPATHSFKGADGTAGRTEDGLRGWDYVIAAKAAKR